MPGFITGVEKSGLLAAVTVEGALRASGSRLALPLGENPARDPGKTQPAAFDLCSRNLVSPGTCGFFCLFLSLGRSPRGVATSF